MWPGGNVLPFVMSEADSRSGEPLLQHYQDRKNCRTFFDEYAKEKGFDPIDTQQWYNTSLRELGLRQVRYTLVCGSELMIGPQGGGQIGYWHGGFKKALRLAYPELQFNKWTHDETVKQ